MKRPVKRIVFYSGVALLAIAGFMAGREMLVPKGWQVDVPSSRTQGAALIGGPFTLVDHTSKTVTEADFRGRFMLIFFGFTYCPDACPTALTVMAEALDIIGPAAARIVPVMISIDPERDTPEQLAMYVRHFHPSLIGLTGSADQVATAAKAFRVYYAKVKEEGSDEGEYTMDHTAIIYLMGPDGKYRAHFSGQAISPEDMAKGILDVL
jgi:cytochrome oxidase Cu insertion factor (SCO1/SenC/PrrC family)